MRSMNGCIHYRVGYGTLLLVIFSAVLSAVRADSEAIPKESHSAPDTASIDSLGAAGFGNRVFDLGSIVVSAIRSDETAFRLPVTAQAVYSQSIQLHRPSRTLPEALRDIPAVSVQKTSYGHGSPYIRGFTGFHTLLLVDGIRLNNSVFREGPNQYAGTIDPLGVSRIEVVKGPGSSLYGSDAVGGTVNVVTSKPLIHSRGNALHSETYYRYSTADNSNVGRMEVSGSFGATLGISGSYFGKTFGDLRPGGGPVLPRTGYDESGMNLGLEYLAGDNMKIEAAHQRMDQHDVWRTHRTVYSVDWLNTTHGNDRHLSTDQHRNLSYLRLKSSLQRGPVRKINVQASYQSQDEDQYRIKQDMTGEKQGFAVRTIGLSVQAESQTRAGTLTYGLDFYRDKVDSYKDRYRADGSFSISDIQGPVADDSRYTQADLFVENKFSLHPRWVMIPAVRFTATNATVGQAANPSSTGDPVLSFARHWSRMTASLRTLLFLDHRERWNVFASVGGAFRSPNLSDLSRFDIARSGEQEVPAPDLHPETFVAYEAGVKHLASTIGAQVAVFFTSIDNLIVRTPRGDSVDYKIAVTKKNSGKGYIYGLEGAVQLAVGSQIMISASGAWLKGSVETYPTSSPILVKEPIDKLMPPSANLSVKWEPGQRKPWLELTVSGAKKQDDLSSADKRDTQRIPPLGTPGYVIGTIRCGVQVTQNLAFSAALENITDRAYRIHGSGQNEAGRNAVFASKVSF